MKVSLTVRQEFLIAKLYRDFGWSPERIARCISTERRDSDGAPRARRSVENALKRMGILLGALPRARTIIQLSEATVTEMFAAAAREDNVLLDQEPPEATATDGQITFRRRRCQVCYTLTTYVKACPRCGEALDWAKSDDEDTI